MTAQRRAEEELRRSEKRFRFLAESMPQIIFTAGPDGRVDYANRRWYEYTGFPSEPARNLDWEGFVHADDLAENLRRWRSSVDTGEPFQVEHRIRGADGTYRWYLTRATALRNADGKVLSWTGSSTDIEDHRRSNDALRVADHNKDEFLAMLAHELRNPLAALDTGLQILADAGGDHAWALDTAGHQVRLLTHMVDDLLDTSRISRGTFRLRKEKVWPAGLIGRVVDTMRYLVASQGHELNVALAPDLPPLDADPARLEQVVGNLLTNAVKYTPEGGRIDLAVGAEGDALVLSVSDTGMGIAPEFLPLVFDPFAQADTSLVRGAAGSASA